MRPRGPLAGFLVVLIALLVVLGVVYVADIVLSVLETARDTVAEELRVNATTEYSSRADTATATVILVIVFTALAIIVVYSLHLERR